MPASQGLPGGFDPPQAERNPPAARPTLKAPRKARSCQSRRFPPRFRPLAERIPAARAAVAQLVRAPDCGSGGRWFESTQLYQLKRYKHYIFHDRIRRCLWLFFEEAPGKHVDRIGICVLIVIRIQDGAADADRRRRGPVYRQAVGSGRGDRSDRARPIGHMLDQDEAVKLIRKGQPRAWWFVVVSRSDPAWLNCNARPKYGCIAKIRTRKSLIAFATSIARGNRGMRAAPIAGGCIGGYGTTIETAPFFGERRTDFSPSCWAVKRPPEMAAFSLVKERVADA